MNPEKWESVCRLINVVPPTDAYWEPDYEPQPLTDEEKAAQKAKRKPPPSQMQGGGNATGGDDIDGYAAPALPCVTLAESDQVDVHVTKYVGQFDVTRTTNVPWSFISRRRTTDLASGKVIDDDFDVQSRDPSYLTRSLPYGVHHIGICNATKHDVMDPLSERVRMLPFRSPGRWLTTAGTDRRHHIAYNCAQRCYKK